MKYFKYNRKLAYVLTSLICSLLLVELALRFAGMIYGQIPYLRQVNKQEYTIVCCGDSFTYGWGVSREQAYPSQLKQLLQSQGEDFCPVSVVNLGVPGTNSSQVLQTIQGLLKQGIKPDMFIILVGANDAWNMASSNLGQAVKLSRFELAQVKVKTFFADMRIYKLIQMIALNLQGKTFESDKDISRQIVGAQLIDKQLTRKTLEFNLEQMIRLLRQEQVEVVLQGYPRGGPLEAGFVKKIAAQFEVIYIEHQADFQQKIQENKQREVFLYDNSHPNAAGYTIMAKNILAAIQDKIKNERENIKQ